MKVMEVTGMGFSIESIVAIPCCLTILAQTAGIALPLGTGVKRTAEINVFVSSLENSQGYTCRYEEIGRGECRIPVVYTCPQKMIESLSLARDFIAIIRTYTSAGSNGDSSQ